MLKLKNIRLHKLRHSLQQLGCDFLYSFNLPSWLGLNLSSGLKALRKNQIIKVKDWLLTKPAATYQLLKTPTSLTLKPQTSLNQQQPPAFAETTLNFPETFLLTLPTANLVGDGLIITSDHKILSDFYNEMGSELIHHQIFTHWSWSPAQTLNGTGTALIDKQNNCYFHWIFDVLPRLFMLENYPGPLDYYLFYELKQNFQLEALQALGLTTDKIIQVNKSSYYQATNLLIPSLPGITGQVPAESCRLLRNKLLDTSEPRQTKYQKIYISRNRAKARRIDNETDLMVKLSNLGFTCLNLEDYTFTEQIAIAHSADIIISPHGSGLTNIVFCQPGTTVIEIFSDTFINTCYRNICQHTQLNYHYYLEPAQRFNSDNIIINLNSFLSCLREARLI
jgi:hypothetical protein